MKWLDSITDSMDMNWSKLQETVKDREAWHAKSMGSQKVGHNLSAELQQIHNRITAVPQKLTQHCKSAVLQLGEVFLFYNKFFSKFLN